jgi:tungstate transport system ATP-binding protein
MSHAYALRDVGFSYGGPDEVLQVDCLDIPAGGITALVGPNGSGKSTLLHLLAFLADPSRGQLRFFDEPVSPEAAVGLRRRVGFLLQNPYLFHTTVAGNVEWGLNIRGFSAQEVRDRSQQALARVELQGYQDRSALALSGGESQRLALARLLALEPEVILLDEPTNHLDRETRARIEATLLEWVQRRGTTVVIATHDVSQAHRLGASVWQMEAGRIREGELENIFRGRLVQGEPGTFDTGKLRLRVNPPPEATEVLRISPREVILAREALSSSALNCLRGTVVRAELNGPEEIRVLLDCGDPIAAVVTRESWQKLGLTVGEEAVAAFKASAVRPA